VGQAPEDIERHIGETRARLDRNVAELRARVRSRLDWRTQVQLHPYASAALAFAGGLVLSLALGRALRNTRLRRRALSSGVVGDLAEGRLHLRAGGRRASWDEVINTFAAMGPDKVRGLFSELLPALRQYVARR
jgi:hypothetical protein